MSELLNKISSDNLLLVCVIMCVIALFLTVVISIEFFNNYRRKKRKTNIEIDEEKLNIKEDSNIKYVEEDEELEKTKAKLELARLKERLEQEEKEKRQLLEINLALANKNNKQENINDKNNTSSIEVLIDNDKKIEVNKKVVEEKNVENNNIDSTNAVKEKVVTANDVENNEDYNNKLSFYEELEEENAIISYDELKKSSSFGYTDAEMDKYVDEKDAIISIDELERLYKESNEIKEEAPQFDIKKVEDLPEISSDKKFQSTPFISPVYGIGSNEDSIQLEQTANLAKLNEEIRKTNEFLKALKELKKNLQ